MIQCNLNISINAGRPYCIDHTHTHTHTQLEVKFTLTHTASDSFAIVGQRVFLTATATCSICCWGHTNTFLYDVYNLTSINLIAHELEKNLCVWNTKKKLVKRSTREINYTETAPLKIRAHTHTQKNTLPLSHCCTIRREGVVLWRLWKISLSPRSTVRVLCVCVILSRKLFLYVYLLNNAHHRERITRNKWGRFGCGGGGRKSNGGAHCVNLVIWNF